MSKGSSIYTQDITKFASDKLDCPASKIPYLSHLQLFCLTEVPQLNYQLSKQEYLVETTNYSTEGYFFFCYIYLLKRKRTCEKFCFQHSTMESRQKAYCLLNIGNKYSSQCIKIPRKLPGAK